MTERFELERWIDERMVVIQRRGAVTFQQQEGLARRRLIIFSVCSAPFCGIGIFGAMFAERFVAIGALITVFLILGFFWLNYRMESRIFRLTLTPRGLLHERRKGASWKRLWYYRWCDIAEIRVSLVRSHGVDRELGTDVVLHDGDWNVVPDLIFGSETEKEMGRLLLRVAHRYFYESSGGITPA